MKKKIISIFLAFTVATFVVTYPSSYIILYVLGKMSIAYFEQIIFPTKRIKVLNHNGFILEKNVCIPYKSLFGNYTIDVNLKDESIKPFETKKNLLNEFDIHVSIYNSDNNLLFYDTPSKIRDKSRNTYYSVILNEYTLPKAGCYKFNIRGISKNKYEDKYKHLHFTIFITHYVF